MMSESAKTSSRGECRWSEPFFVISNTRSGSTLLCHALNAHPAVALTNEANFVAVLKLVTTIAALSPHEPCDIGPFHLVGVMSGAYSGEYRPLLQAHLLASWREFLEQRFRHKAFTVWGDKFFLHEVLDDAFRFFPGARLIHLVRDGRDRVLSALAFHRRIRQVDPHHRNPDFTRLCEEWRDLNVHVANGFGGRDSYLSIRYEDLVARPRDVLSSATGFLGLPMAGEVECFLDENSDALFHAHGTSGRVESSVGRWRSEMTREQRGTASRIIGPTLKRFGYVE
ncbi:MAG: sulfotransferase [Proteobacteria bacterium]|nr:MAG: sulfotransferase [Pseudomonadota bacterium]